MKRWGVILCVAYFCFTVAACNGHKDSDTTAPDEVVTEDQRHQKDQESQGDAAGEQTETSKEEDSVTTAQKTGTDGKKTMPNHQKLGTDSQNPGNDDQKPVTESQISDIQDQVDETLTGDMVILTSFAKLKYPVKWEQLIRAEVKDEKAAGCEVHFYVNFEGMKEQKLFTISFGKEGTMPAGSIMKGSVGYDVYMTIPEPDEENMEREDVDIYYAMQEDINYIFDKMEQEAEYVPFKE